MAESKVQFSNWMEDIVAFHKAKCKFVSQRCAPDQTERRKLDKTSYNASNENTLTNIRPV